HIDLSYAEPANAASYVRAFGCPVRFGQPRDHLVLDAELLSLRLPLAHPETHQLLLRACDERMVRLDASESFGRRVRLEIARARDHSRGQLLGLEEVAERFCLSARTLRRRLAEEDTTFQQITDSIRRDLSVQLLTGTRLSAKEIAFDLGYSSVNNFRRAFK